MGMQEALTRGMNQNLGILRGQKSRKEPSEITQPIIQTPTKPDATVADFTGTQKVRRRRTADVQADFSPSLEKREEWTFREAGAQDIDGIMDLFREYDLPRRSKNGIPEKDSDHVGHEDVTAFIPTDWANEKQVAMFRKMLNTFYLGGSFEVKAKYTDDILTIERYSEVCVLKDKNGKDRVVAVASILTDDPYVSPKDRGRIKKGYIKPAYAHMVLVASEYRQQRITSWLAGRFAQKFMVEGDYDQMTGGIDMEGDWMKILYGLMNLGYVPDHRPEGRYKYKDEEGREINGQRIIMEKENWIKYREKVYKLSIEKLGTPQPRSV